MNTLKFTLTQAAFAATSVIFFGLLLVEFKRALSRSSYGSPRQKKIFRIILFSLIAWTVFVSAWSISGRMGNFTLFPFNVMPILVIPMATILWATFSKAFREMLVHIPPQNLVRIQSFRIIVELLLWALFVQDLAPVQMTFEGSNLDVLSGLSALLIAYLASRRKLSNSMLVAWNIACLLLLVNIIYIAIVSMPTPLRMFQNEPSNTIVTVFPISWLPGLLVPLAYGLHFLSLRQVALQKKSSPAVTQAM